MSPAVIFGKKTRRALAIGWVALLPFFLGGWITGPQSTFEPMGPVARVQQDTFYVSVWVCLVIFILVGGVLAYATLKFRARDAHDEHAAPPEQSHGNPLVELSLIGVSVLALVVIAVPTLRGIWYSYDVPENARGETYEVVAIGYQWWFRFDYPAEQVEGTGHLITANELVIPSGRPVRIQLRTQDVIHSFWVPKLAGKVDMIPNRGNQIWLQADQPGYYWGQCAEFCGESHAVMRFRVIALAPDDFEAWVEARKQPARTVPVPVEGPAELPRVELANYTFRPNQGGYSAEFDLDPMGNWYQKQFPDANEEPALIARGRQLFQEKTCVACHTVRGHEGVGITGPDLTHIGSRTTIAGGLLENTEANMVRWLSEPNNVKPGNLMFYGRAMPGYMRRTDDGNWVKNFEVTLEESVALTAYLHSLK